MPNKRIDTSWTKQVLRWSLFSMRANSFACWRMSTKGCKRFLAVLWWGNVLLSRILLEMTAISYTWCVPSNRKTYIFQPFPNRKTYIFHPVPLEKRTFFSHFRPKKYVFRPVPPEKRTFFSQFRPKNVHFSAISKSKKRTFFIRFRSKNVRFSVTSAQKSMFFGQFRPKNVRFSVSSARPLHFSDHLTVRLFYRHQTDTYFTHHHIKPMASLPLLWHISHGFKPFRHFQWA